MKVAYILPDLQRSSGWQSHNIAFLKALLSDIEPFIYVSNEDCLAAQEIFSSRLIFGLPVTQHANIQSRHGLRKLAECYWNIHNHPYTPPDLVHSLEAYPTGLIGHWLAGKHKCPHIITVHGTYGVIWYQKWLDRIAYERVLRKASLICPVSHGTATLMQRYFGPVLDTVRLHPILNGNDFYHQIDRSIATNREFNTQAPTLLSVGDLKPRKGQHLSLAAFSIVKKQLPGARYWIVGKNTDQSYYRQLHAIISENQLSGVTFWGSVSKDQLQDLYQQADIFLLTPIQDGLRFEGFGLVYLEAGAYGLPVVATHSGGVADAVKDGETGILVDPDNVNAIAEAILQLTKDERLAARMGHANRAWAETLTWERSAQEYHHAYQQVLNNLEDG